MLLINRCGWEISYLSNVNCKRTCTALVALLVVASACEQKLPAVVERTQPDFTLDFLVGEWSNITDSTAFYEHWEKMDDGFFSGKGFVMRGTDTTFIEELSILRVSDQWLYSARVYGQNSDAAVAFRLAEQTKDGIAFENPTHDYPQRIAYERKSPYALEATISGVTDGASKSRVFAYKRITALDPTLQK